jgi:hypothetical protein
MAIHHLTIGYRRASDGIFDILATFNLQNCPEKTRCILDVTARQIALEFDAEILERQDTPSSITLNQCTTETNGTEM